MSTAAVYCLGNHNVSGLKIFTDECGIWRVTLLISHHHHHHHHHSLMTADECHGAVIDL